MLYHLARKNPYSCKKVSLWKKIGSSFFILFSCGILVLESGHMTNMYFISQSEENYRVAVSYYDDLVKETAYFMKQNASTVEDYFNIYNKLLWEGYFSKDQTYEYQSMNQMNVIGNDGMLIALGKGDCKNNSDLFYHIMKELGYQTYQVVCVSIDASTSYPEYITGNHVITVVEDNQKEYYFDPTNGCTYEKKEIVYRNEEKNISIILKPLTSYMLGYNNKRETIELLQILGKRNSGESQLTNDIILSVKKERKFQKTIEPLIKRIYTSFDRKEFT